MACPIKNVGKADKIFRIILGLLSFAAGFYFKSWWGLLGLIPFLTGLVNFCPIYAGLKISSRKKK